MDCIAAYDFGTSGVKIALVSKTGELLSVREESYPLYRPAPLYVEQEPDDYWNAVCKVTRDAIAESGISPSSVKALSFSVQYYTIIPVSSDGKVLYRAVSWLDSRAVSQAEHINEQLGYKAVRAQDFQPRMLWFKENEPDLYDETAYFLDCNTFLQFKATGVLAVTRDHRGAVRYHDSYARFLKETLAFVDEGKVPTMVEPCSVYGTVDEKGASELGVTPGIPVFGGMIDVPAAAAGCGCVLPGDAHVYLGSSGWLSVITNDQYPASPGAYQINSILPGRYIYGGCTNSCGLMLRWGIEQFYSTEYEELGDDIYDYLEKEMSDVPDGCDGLIAAPWLDGEQFPIEDTNIRAIFFNIKGSHKRAYFIKAILESLCFSMLGQLELYRKDTGSNIDLIGANGGGARSDTWMQMMSNVMGIPLRVSDNPRHNGAVGASIAAAIGLGWCDEDDVSRFAVFNKTFFPDKAKTELYRRQYDVFMKLYDISRDLYSELNGGQQT